MERLQFLMIPLELRNLEWKEKERKIKFKGLRRRY